MHLSKVQTSMALTSVFTVFRFPQNRMHLSKVQTSLDLPSVFTVFPSVGLNHGSGCVKWYDTGVKACFYRQRHNTWHRCSEEASIPQKGSLLFLSSSKELPKVESLIHVFLVLLVFAAKP